MGEKTRSVSAFINKRKREKSSLLNEFTRGDHYSPFLSLTSPNTSPYGSGAEG